MLEEDPLKTVQGGGERPSMRKCQNWTAFAFVVVKIDSIQISANENVHL